MAFDEWLYCRALASPATVFLRLYTWRPGTITFGVNQRQQTALNFGRLGETPVVRRITGGRALYHDPSELTYAIAVNAERLDVPGLSGSLSETSRTIALALGSFLETFSIETSYVQKSSPADMKPEYFHKAPCFASAARHELMAGDRKVVASAQKRLGTSLLQHGSMKINGVVSHPALAGIGDRLDSSVQAIDTKALKEFAESFRVSMGKSLGLEFRLCDLTEHEMREVDVRATQVEKNALSKRVIVAQNDSAASL